MSDVATRHGHDWRIVAPWYRWALADGSDPSRAAEAGRPALHKFVSTDFVADFLRDPQRSVVFNGSVDVLQRVTPIPDSELFDGGRQKWISSTRLAPDPSGTRKLFLPAHQRFYLVAVGLHCDRAGFPRVDPENVAEVGFVVRRHRRPVPPELTAEAAKLVHDVRAAKATASVRYRLDIAKQRSRLLHPFRSAGRDRVASPGAATVAAAREVELARRRLRTWARTNSIEDTTEGWVTGDEGAFGSWVAMPDEPEELVERAYPMRLLRPAADDPLHAAHDGTIYYAVVPTASDEVTDQGVARFSELDTYELRAYVRAGCGPCPGPLVWSAASLPFRIASYYDPAGSAQRPTEIRLPDFRELEASDAMPSVRMTAPPGSSLEFSKFGDTPTKGRVGGAEEICFFSIPLITIIAMFVLNLFLPIVLFVFGLWWMLKLKFCIPPSVGFEADLAAELAVEPPGLELMAGVDIDIVPGTNPADIAAVLRNIFDPPDDPSGDLDPVPDEWKLGTRLLEPAETLFTNNALFQLALRSGYGRSADPAPRYSADVEYTTPVRRDEVVHP